MNHIQSVLQPTGLTVQRKSVILELTPERKIAIVATALRLIKYGNLILIEDTRFRATIQAKKGELKFLKDAPEEFRDQYINHVIVTENVVKVYGSLFVLYKLLNMRLNSSSSEVFPSIESIQFWLVANDSELWAEKSWEHYKLVIENGLYGRLGHNFIRSVKVIRKDRLSDALSRVGTG